MVNRNAPWKLAAAIAAVLALSAPAAVGVFRALAPTRGPWAAGLAALGFELAYLSLSLLTLRPELRRQARAVALGAVATSISLNVLADYAARVAGGLESWPRFVATFDGLALGLAVVESAPLAGLAFALASLLHRLAEEPGQGEHTPADRPQVEPAPLWAGPVLMATPSASWPRVEAYPPPVKVSAAPIAPIDSNAANAPVSAPAPAEAPAVNAERVTVNSSNAPAAAVYACRHCGAEGLTKGEQLEHGRRHARERKGAADA